jgi:hypothetical protein
VNRSERGKPWLVWLSATAASAIIGCSWAMAIARYGGPDEPAHVIRAAAAAHGDLRGRPVAKLEPGYREVRVPATFATGDPACYRHSETTSAACAVASNETADVGVATSAGTAPPWYYVIVGVITRMLSAGHAVMAYRMASVLLCALVFGYAMARAIGSRRGAWLVIALTPSSWFLVAVVGTSGIEIALVALALVEAVARFHPSARPESLARVTVPLAICLVLRPAAAIDIAVVALVLIPTLPRPVTKRRVGVLVLPLALAGVASLAWSRWTGMIVRDRRTADTESFLPALWRSVRGIPLTAHQAVGALGWNEFFAPFIAQAVWVGMLAFAVWVVAQSTDRWWHLRWIVLAVLLPTVVEVIVHRRIGEIWQGRYSIPFAIAGVLYGARGPRPSMALMRGLVFAAACAEVLTLWQTLRRYMVGLDGSMTLQGAAWRPPLNPWLLLAVNAAGIAWLAVMALAPIADDDPDQATIRTLSLSPS